MDQISDR